MPLIILLKLLGIDVFFEKKKKSHFLNLKGIKLNFQEILIKDCFGYGISCQAET